MNIAKLLEQSTKKYPRKKALIFKDKKYRYRQINDIVNQFANLFTKKHTINKGSHIGILLNNCPEYIFSVFAILKTGSVVIPINRFLTTSEIQFIIDDCNITHLITESKFSSHIKPLLESCKGLQRIISINDIPNEQSVDLLYPDAQNYSTDFSAVTVKESDIALIIYTSGTTGYPKGAMLSHNNIISNVLACTDVIKITHKDKFLLILPMFHSFTFTVCIIMPFANGATIIALPSIKPFSTVIRSVLKYRVSVFIGIPKLYDILSEKKLPFFIRWLLNIRLCISGSAPLPEATLERFKSNIKLPLLEGYGLSEASPVVSINPLNGVRKAGSVGTPIRGVKVRIVDENMHDVPQGEVGEIIVNGNNIMLGYYNKPEETANTLIDGWLHTGDLGKYDKDNYLYIVDRKKNMLLIHGMNVYPREIEEVIISHPAIAETAVIGLTDHSKNEIPVGFIVLKDGKNISPKEIMRLCKKNLAGYKCPRRIITIEKLPRSPVGKILKNKLLLLIKK